MKNKKGFTLVELLVVIAIIGILSSVAVVNLNSARTKARVAAAEGSLSNLMPAIILCFDDEEELQNHTNPCNGAAAAGNIVAGQAICDATGAPNWPALPSTAWSYNTTSCNSDSANGTFTFDATGDSMRVTCNQNGCSSAAT
jgi:prepilin-type N-terminal cleavage/methylation domain-containing protein